MSAMSLTVTVLGCSGTYPEAGGACSGYLVRSPTTAVWLDAGPGTLGNLQRHVALPDVDAVVVSHAHPDHWLELPVLRNALKYGLGLGDRHLPTYGTQETHDLLTAVVGRSHGGVAPTLDWHTIADRQHIEVGDLTVSFSRTDHPVETLAMRFDHDGRSLGYSADTGPGWSLSEFAALGPRGPVDLALCEASLDRSQERTVQHLSARQAGASAKAAGAGRLVLTHLVPGRDPAAAKVEATAVFDGSIEVAAIGVTYEV
jgi:ribonuclease BN (tRNA processing enzyme)